MHVCQALKVTYFAFRSGLGVWCTASCWIVHDAFSAMLEARSVRWVPFHRCTSREQELSARSYNKELQVMQSQDGKLSLKEGQASRHANVSDGLRVQQAMSRRALKSPASPPSTPCRSGTLTSSILLHNLHKASRQLLWSSCGWVYPTRWGASLPSDHDFPVDQAIQELMLTPPVAMQLLPRPSRAVPERVNRPGPPKGSPKGRGKSPAKSKGKAQPSFTSIPCAQSCDPSTSMASSGSFSFGCSAAVPLLPTPSFSFPSQPAASSFPFTNDPAPTPGASARPQAAHPRKAA